MFSNFLEIKNDNGPNTPKKVAFGGEMDVVSLPSRFEKTHWNGLKNAISTIEVD